MSFLPDAGRWHVKNIKPTSNGDAQEVKIKVRINNNGVILVTSANLVDKKAAKAVEDGSPGDNTSGTENGNNMDTQEVSQHKPVLQTIYFWRFFFTSFCLFVLFNCKNQPTNQII